MIALDLRSLFFVTSLLSLLCAAILLLMRRSFPSSVGGLKYWGWGSVGCVASTAMLGLRDVIPDFFSVVLATGFLIGSTMLMYIGMLDYAGTSRKKNNRLLLGVLAGVMCWSAWFTFIYPSYPMRAVLVSAVQAGFCFASAKVLLRVSGSMLVGRFTGGILLVIAYVSIARLIGILTQFDTSSSLFDASLTQKIYAVIFSLSILTLTVGMMMLANERLRAELEYIVAHDALSGAFSRGTFMNLMDMELDRAQRNHRPIAILMFDLDKFKSINDQYGHLIGDRVIINFVALVQDQLRKHDCIGRYGGEEFIALLPETIFEDARAVAQRICDHVAASRTPGLPAYTVSIGVASLSDAAISLEDFLNRADQALYQSKQNGRNRVEPALPLSKEMQLQT